MIYTCIKYPIPGLVDMFVYNDPRVSLNPQYMYILAAHSNLFILKMKTVCKSVNIPKNLGQHTGTKIR